MDAIHGNHENEDRVKSKALLGRNFFGLLPGYPATPEVGCCRQ